MKTTTTRRQRWPRRSPAPELCTCGHLLEEHDSEMHVCIASPDCDCQKFEKVDPKKDFGDPDEGNN
jgi:predicted  nucleic acid-binding Zn-ribbon protein